MDPTDMNPRPLKRMRLQTPEEVDEEIQESQENLDALRLANGNLFDNPLTRVSLWKKSASFMVLGRKGAGKSTFLRMLNHMLYQFQPWYPFTDILEIRSITLKSFDLDLNDDVGSDGMARYYNMTDGIIFMVDSSDRRAISESRSMLRDLLLDDSMHGPILIIGSKCDKQRAVSRLELYRNLGLYGINRYEISPYFELSMCSARGFNGYPKALEFLSRHIGEGNISAIAAAGDRWLYL